MVWPGSRWWRCDLHIHSPGSYDFRGDVDAAAWVRAAVAAGLDVVGLTDHNSGSFIDDVKEAAAGLDHALVIFPGVELTTSEGIHALVLFDTSGSAATITAFLGACGIPGAKHGDADAMATIPLIEAVGVAEDHGGIVIPAHIDDPKGFLKALEAGNAKFAISRHGGFPAFEVQTGDARVLEWLDSSAKAASLPPRPWVQSSDAHCLEDMARRTTWLKMEKPDLRGLRLALHDGVDSVKPGTDDPTKHGLCTLEAIEICEARVIGRGGTPLVVTFNPWFNALIGGRGSGKSSVLECLRLALGQDASLAGDEQRAAFESFSRGHRKKGDTTGALRDVTTIVVTWRRGEARFRVRWSANDESRVLESFDADVAQWNEFAGDVADLCPVRVLSQREVFELSKSSNLLDVVDRVGSVAEERDELEERRIRADLMSARRDLRAGVAELGERRRLEGRLEASTRELATLTQAGNARVVEEYSARLRDQATLNARADLLHGVADKLQSTRREVESDLGSVDLKDLETEDSESAPATWLKEANAGVRAALDIVPEIATKIVALARFDGDLAFKWEKTSESVEGAYRAVSEALGVEGAELSARIKRLLEDQAATQDRLSRLTSETEPRVALLKVRVDELVDALWERREQLAERRRDVLTAVAEKSDAIRATLRKGGDRPAAEIDLRERLGLGPSAFASDVEILLKIALPTEEPGATSSTVAQLLGEIKEIRDNGASDWVRDQRFVERLRALPDETIDELFGWVPPDALRLELKSGGTWIPMAEGSPGQRSASVLAVLLAVGDEPIVLDQPEDDLDNAIIHDLIVGQVRERRAERQLIVATHNPNVVVNGDAEQVVVMNHAKGNVRVRACGSLQDRDVADSVCAIMEGGRDALTRRYSRMLHTLNS